MKDINDEYEKYDKYYKYHKYEQKRLDGLYSASVEGHVEIVRLILDRAGDLDDTCKLVSYTQLYVALNCMSH